jgi:hypothetical protein
MEQSDSQLMMAAQRGLSLLDARRSEHALLTWTIPALSRRKSTRLPRLTNSASATEREPRVQIQFQRREHLSFGLSRELMFQ